MTSTITPAQNASSGSGSNSDRMPSHTDSAPPMTNMPTAASNAQ